MTTKIPFVLVLKYNGPHKDIHSEDVRVSQSVIDILSRSWALDMQPYPTSICNGPNRSSKSVCRFVRPSVHHHYHIACIILLPKNNFHYQRHISGFISKNHPPSSYYEYYTRPHWGAKKKTNENVQSSLTLIH